MGFVGKILPIEGFTVRINEKMPLDYLKSLTHLYQPLLGIKPIMLYQTLLHEIDIQSPEIIQTHHTLMNYLNVPLDDLYQARLKLEGIGLLKTFKNTSVENHQYIYVYELCSPFSPADFFQDAMLMELLFHHLGEEKYNLLKKHFQKKMPSEDVTEITASFKDVFQTFKPIFEEQHPAENIEDNEQNLVQPIDFSWIDMMLKQRMIPAKKILTIQNKKMITEMMFLYDLAAYEIEKAVLWALTEENLLDTDGFKAHCHDLFKRKHHQTPIQLTSKTPEQIEPKQMKQPQTREEKIAHRFETISPKHLLEDLSSGNQASAQDMKIVQEVMISQGLPVPVMNVLIHYVLLRSNMKLSKAYLEKIASHWSRANLKTAREAMAFSKTNEKSFSQQRSFNKKQKSNEIIPEWFENRNQQLPKDTKYPHDTQVQKEKEEIDVLLQQFADE